MSPAASTVKLPDGISNSISGPAPSNSNEPYTLPVLFNVILPSPASNTIFPSISNVKSPYLQYSFGTCPSPKSPKLFLSSSVNSGCLSSTKANLLADSFT